ncbi:MAG: alpha-glucan family phosphorylase [Cyanobacteriota bacterium]
MKTIHSYNIVPAIPEELKCLEEMAHNLYTMWDHEVIDLFRRLDVDLWEKTYHNPVLMLGKIKQEKLEIAAKDETFIAYMKRVYEKYKAHMSETTWFQKHYGNDKEVSSACIAYFSAEFGLTECLPIYSGGLGVLAGDHLKSASELGLPLVGVGLCYQRGYFQQYLNKDGWQQETYPVNDFHNLPLVLCKNGNGEPITISVELPGRDLKAQIWKALVGRVPLYLLDTNIPENSKKDQDLTDYLYGGDKETRIQQEILLGIGGLRALKALGINPTINHINEGHSAFLSLEKIRTYMKENSLSFTEAKELARGGNIFTTHTPVPAGIDIFPIMLMDKYFGQYYNELAISRDEFLSLGRKNEFDRFEDFNMAVFAIKLSSYTNGVSKLHGDVSRKMWQGIWPELPEEEIPITSITNGIFPQSWTSRDMVELFNRYLGTNWAQNLSRQDTWFRVDSIPSEELWNTHQRRRERLVAFTRKRLREQLIQRGATQAEINEADEVLDPKAFTIGFARRFATYKRANLILQDLERLASILNHKEKPVQIIFAGKAHPHDSKGKELIRELIHVGKQDEFRHKIVFIENYDMNVARYMVQGVDIWLNNPLRPQEASGTSGMKVCFNGGLNCSVLDGWWDEAYTPGIGWAIGRGEVYDDPVYQNQVESNAIYDLLEKEIVPTFYDRTVVGLPRKWVDFIKHNMKVVCPMFNTHRMVQEYTDLLYATLIRRKRAFKEEDFRKIREIVQWKHYIYKNWNKVNIQSVTSNIEESHSIVKVGEIIKIQADVYLGELKPEDVAVQIYYGTLNVERQIINGHVITLDYIESPSEGVYRFAGSKPALTSGLHGYSARVVPSNSLMVNPFELGLITWQ